MRKRLISRLQSILVVLFLVSVMSFSLIPLLPGDPAQAMLGPDASEEMVKELRTELGLDKPVPVQYLAWASNVVQGDLGTSFRNGQPVGEAILQRLPATFQLTLAALIISLLVALPLGIVSATRRGSKTDLVATVIAVLGACVPNFWLGSMLILVFSLWLHWLPASGYVSIFTDPARSLMLTIMPALTLSAMTAAVTMRQVRSSMIEVLGEDYVTTARAKGLSEPAVVRVHALRNALIPVITVVGLQASRLFGGAVIVESIFAIPGLGRLVLDSIFARDFPMVQGVLLTLALIVLVINLACDILYSVVDPRIKNA
jgi:peptide/nickel transport system permease protein